jgi:hypothetical protein
MITSSVLHRISTEFAPISVIIRISSKGGQDSLTEIARFSNIPSQHFSSCSCQFYKRLL